MSTVVNTSFQGLMDSIKKSKYPLAPIYEAITNSLEAILQKEYSDNQQPEIDIIFNYSGLLQAQRRLESITIKDNGAGFNTENFERFETLLDKSKGFNNRGSGRIQFVHRFGRVEVESVFQENQNNKKRTFSCNATRFTYDHSLEDLQDSVTTGSSVTLIAGDTLSQDQVFYDELQLIDLAKEIKKHFLLRFHLANQNDDIEPAKISITFTKNNDDKQSIVIEPKDMPAPSETGEFTVSYLKLENPNAEEIAWKKVPDKDEKLNWAHFELPDDDLQNNAIYLCSKGVSVQALSYDALKKNETIDGKRYLTVFYGGVLDEPTNVSDTVDSFNLDDQKQIEEMLKEGDLYLPHEEFLFFDTIKDRVSEVMPHIYKNIVTLKEQQNLKVEEIAKEHAIPPELAKKIKINLSDDEEKITKKLYQAQANDHADDNQEIRKAFSELKALDPTSETYQEDLKSKSSQVLEMIPELNRKELGRYVIRREMVAEVLNKILNEELDYQTSEKEIGKNKDKEGLIHDLIFKRKSKDTSELNDLWILNEEYVHFEGCSELQINQISDADGNKLLKEISADEVKDLGLKPKRRPDIFLYAEEGKCVIIELKAPDVDLTDHLNQMVKYCNLIANYSVSKIEKFYCYLVGENFNHMDLPGEYTKTVNGDWISTGLRIRSFDENSETIAASAQIEIIKLSSIYDRAYRRNKSFADKLGLREDDE